MAGIGFRLQKLLSGDTYTDILKAYLYSAMIASGPMLLVIFSLGFVKYWAGFQLGIEEESLFMGLVVYAFAFSMIGVSPLFLVVTRYLADQYYLRLLDNFSAAYVGTVLIVLLSQTVLAVPFLWLLPLPLALKITTYTLYMCVCCIWIAMVFLSAAQGYLWIVLAYALGGGAGIILALILGQSLATLGFLQGFTLGQILIFLVLSWRIFREFGYSYAYQFSFLRYFRKYPLLMTVSILYYLGIWIDKFIFWFFSPKSETIAQWIKVCPDYDTPMFLAFLTVVPSLAFFLIQMETSFVKCFYSYFHSVRNRSNLNTIRYYKQLIANNLSTQFQRFAIYQGLISGVVILLTYQIANAFQMSPSQMGVFRIAILGAFMQVGGIMILNVLFYFDAQLEACILTGTFLLMNAGLTAWSLHLGLPAYGFGYAVAGFVTLVLGFFLLDYRLRNLSYWTFMRQPIIIPRFKLASDEKK